MWEEREGEREVTWKEEETAGDGLRYGRPGGKRWNIYDKGREEDMRKHSEGKKESKEGHKSEDTGQVI